MSKEKELLDTICKKLKDYIDSIQKELNANYEVIKEYAEDNDTYNGIDAGLVSAIYEGKLDTAIIFKEWLGDYYEN